MRLPRVSSRFRSTNNTTPGTLNVELLYEGYPEKIVL